MTAGEKITLAGWDAIEAKMTDDSIVLHNYNTPIDPADDDITEERAREIADEDPTLIWCDIDCSDPDMESLENVLREILNPTCLHMDPAVMYDLRTGEFSIRSQLVNGWNVGPYIVCTTDPAEWAGSVFGDNNGHIDPETALDGVDDDWLYEYAIPRKDC